MSVEDLMSSLHRLNVELWVDGHRLRYRAPKGILTPVLRSEIAEHKAELLALVQARQLDSASRLPPPFTVSRDRSLPLSFAQQRLWFLDQLEPHCTTYNLSIATRFSGTLNIMALEKSLNEIVRRHEILRTIFPSANGQPLQVIIPETIVTLPVVDLSHTPKRKREAECQQIIHKDMQQSFDLSQGPLVRFKLLILTTEEYLLLLTAHHIVYDGWSHGVFKQELGSLYEAFAVETSPSLPNLPIQYADFSVWQRQWLQGELLEHHIAYWKRQLDSYPPQLNLPTDGLRQTAEVSKSGHQLLYLSSYLTSKFKALSQQEGCTLFMTLLAAFKTLLFRLTGQEDIVVGTSVPGRHWGTTDQLIGFFLNNLVLRTDVSGIPTFRELIQRIHKVCKEAYAHQDLPFERLVEELHPERDLHRNPMFQVFFNFVSFSPQRLHTAGLTIHPVWQFKTESKFDLTFDIREQDDQLRCEVIYNSILFNASRMREMLDQFQHLLQQIVENPDQPITVYNLVTPRAAALLPDPRAPITEPPYSLVTELVASWGRDMPDQPAIHQGDDLWTYGELLHHAQTLAQVLLARGLQRGDIVAVIGAKSFGLYASMLGVLMGGGAFLTVDPILPATRKQLMLREARVRHLVWLEPQPSEAENLFQDMALPAIIHVSARTGVAIEAEHRLTPETIPLPELSPDDAAYVIFTSGTTGVPKGILGCHKGLSHFLNWQREKFAVGPQDRCSQLTAISFDGVLRDVFLPLTSGACLCVPEVGQIDAAQVLPWLERQEVSILHAVPTLVQSWLSDVPEDITLRSLRWAFFVGEPLADILVQRWRQTFPEAGRVVNFYGSTETTLVKCFQVLPEALLPGIQPVGHALPQAQALVLNSEGHLCGIGEAGEIVLRTPFRTLGYLNAPEETRQRLRKNPFRYDDRDILHYTGDRGRYRPDGGLDMLGRLDHQVNIQGVRVEPGEVMVVLGQHTSVDACVVVAQQNEQDQSILVAYVVPQGQNRVTVSELRSYLRTRLPSVMIPSAFVFLASLPRTPNGKVDHRALPVPDQTRPVLDEHFVAPRTPVEEVLVGIWSSVLRVEPIGVFDNFFDLGGHSLMAVQVMSRLRDALQMDVPLRAMFAMPTVAGLAQHLETTRQAFSVRTVSPILRVSRAAHLPLSFAQQRVWFLEQLEADRSVYNLPFAWRFTGHLNVAALKKSLDDIVRRHDILRTTFSGEHGQPVQVIAPALTLELPVTDLQHLSETEREAAAHNRITEESRQSFDLAQGPLLRCLLLRLTAEDHLFCLTLHHIIFDDWSVEIFWRELTTLYAAYDAGESALLPELPIQYADFAMWQRQKIKGEILEAQLSYWRQQLGDRPEGLDLPTDRPRSRVQSFRGARDIFHLNAPLTAGLKALSRQEDATLFMTLLTAFYTLLFRYTGQEHLRVGTPVTDRTQMETEHLLGFFVNTLVLHTDLGGNPPFRELLKRVREVVLGAYEHRDLPFEKLVEALHVERDPSRAPLFQVMFALQNSPPPTLDLPGLHVAPIAVDTNRARFDLTLIVRETDDGLRGVFEYNTDLFDATTMARMASHFQVLLNGVMDDPAQCLSTLPLLTEAERHQMLATWNDTATTASHDLCFHQLFEDQVRPHPESVAVVYMDQHLTYAALNQRADQLAHDLLTLGVGPDQCVGLCMTRSIEMIIGVLGILKAGGAFVPLDPAYPKERLAFMLKDAKVSILLTQPHMHDQLPASDASVISMDADWGMRRGQVAKTPLSGVRADHLAYVMYTSGSTGVPKGTMIAHRGLVNYLQWCMKTYIDPAGHGAPVHTSMGFDATITSLFAPLLAGQPVVFLPQAQEFAALHTAVQTQPSFSFIKLTPAHLSLVNAQLSREMAAGAAKMLILGGEALSGNHLRFWRTHAPHTRLVNEYGPTETVVGCCVYELQGQDSLSGDIPIGRPIANTQLYLLDANLQPVPIGVTGELYIGGVGLARGYCNHPEWTAERFVPNPFGEMPGARLYKTGDAARYLSDGNLEFLGRLDQQVNLRGFRIELEEIATVLGQHPDVREAVVVAQEGPTEAQRLVAYVVPRRAHAPGTSALRHVLKATLPDYMMPSAFVMLEALPLTPNGKVDQRALPAPGRLEHALTTPEVMPRTHLEHTLVTVWRELLQVEHVGIHDNFFDLGGHSLLMVQLHLQLQALLQSPIALIDLFIYPTISTLAAYLGQESDAQPAPQPHHERAESRRASVQRRRQSRQRFKS